MKEIAILMAAGLGSRQCYVLISAYIGRGTRNGQSMLIDVFNE